MRVVAFLAAAAMAAAPCAAQACMMEPLPQASVFEMLPSVRPEGTIRLKVEESRNIPDTWLWVAKVAEGPRKTIGRYYRFSPESLSSCTAWGRDAGWIDVFPEAQPSESGAYLSAVTYERSWGDAIFGWLLFSPYRWAGERYEQLPTAGEAAPR